MHIIFILFYFFSVCKTEMKGYRGVIESPNFPQAYPTLLECDWVIVAPLGNKINISFSDLNIPYNCSDDYVEVRFFYFYLIFIHKKQIAKTNAPIFI